MNARIDRISDGFIVDIDGVKSFATNHYTAAIIACKGIAIPAYDADAFHEAIVNTGGSVWRKESALESHR